MTKSTPILILIIVFFTSFSTLFAQTQKFNKKYKKIDKWVAKTPEDATANIESLTTYLTKKAKTEEEKLRAIYIWIANNIVYDDTAFYDGKKIFLAMREGHKAKQQPEMVLKNRMAVCEGYANLLKAMCNQANLQAEVIMGYCTDLDGKLADMRHAWNAVLIDNEWRLTDVTWGASGLHANEKRYKRFINDLYFLQEKETFLTSHFPDDPIWQLSETLKLERDFVSEWRNHPIAEKTFEHYKDTLNKWLKLPKEIQKVNKIQRIAHYYPNNIEGLAFYYDECLIQILAQVSKIDSAFKDELVESRYVDLNYVKEIENVENNIAVAQGYFNKLMNELDKDKFDEFTKTHNQVLMPLTKTWLAVSKLKLGFKEALSVFEKISHQEEEIDREEVDSILNKFGAYEKNVEEAKKQIELGDTTHKEIRRYRYEVRALAGILEMLKVAFYTVEITADKEDENFNYLAKRPVLEKAIQAISRAKDYQQEALKYKNNVEILPTLALSLETLSKLGKELENSLYNNYIIITNRYIKKMIAKYNASQQTPDKQTLAEIEEALAFTENVNQQYEKAAFSGYLPSTARTFSDSLYFRYQQPKILLLFNKACFYNNMNAYQLLKIEVEKVSNAEIESLLTDNQNVKNKIADIYKLPIKETKDFFEVAIDSLISSIYALDVSNMQLKMNIWGTKLGMLSSQIKDVLRFSEADKRTIESLIQDIHNEASKINSNPNYTKQQKQKTDELEKYYLFEGKMIFFGVYDELFKHYAREYKPKEMKINLLKSKSFLLEAEQILAQMPTSPQNEALIEEQLDNIRIRKEEIESTLKEIEKYK